MKYHAFGSWYIVRIDRNEEIIQTLKDFCSREKIALGTISGIGATGDVTIGLFNTKTKTYQSKNYSGDFELTSITGNITTRDGEVYLHIHATISDNLYHVYGGHLSKAVISGTCEIFIQKIEGAIQRVSDETVGLNVLNLELK